MKKKKLSHKKSTIEVLKYWDLKKKPFVGEEMEKWKKRKKEKKCKRRRSEQQKDKRESVKEDFFKKKCNVELDIDVEIFKHEALIS